MKHLKEILLVDNSGEQCYLITKERVTEIVELRSTQQEADTRMITHMLHETSKYSTIIVAAEDTDVFAIFLTLHSDIIGTKQINIFSRCGKKKKIWLADISSLATMLGLDLCKELTVILSVQFAGQGNIKPINLVRKNNSFTETFGASGTEWSVSELVLDAVRAFT